MKHKFLIVFMAIATALCMAFGFTACGEKNPDETGNNPPITDPSGGNQGEQGSQGNQGEQGGTQKPEESEQGGVQKPDEGEQGGTQKPDEGEQEPETYTEGLFYSEMYGEDGTTVIGYSVGAGEAADEEEIVIPSKYNDLPVLSISRSEKDEAFWNKFNEECKDLPEEETFTFMQKYTFSACANLKKIKIPNSVTTIGQGAFTVSGLTSITIPNSVTTIGMAAFGNCIALTSITIPGSVSEIGRSAFSTCEGLTSVIIENGVKTIGSFAFEGCSGLTEITIPNSVTSIEGCAFSDCSGLTSVTIGKGVTTIGGSAFTQCIGLTSVTIPDNVTEIGASAFWGCSGLTSVTIGSGVTKIKAYAFKSCSNLKEVHFKSQKGWNAAHHVIESSEEGSREVIDDQAAVTGLDNATTAAEYLTETYCEYQWERG